MSYQEEQLLSEIREMILAATNRRVWNLKVEVAPDLIVLNGFTNTYHSKQLAQESVRKKLPNARVKNAISVLS